MGAGISESFGATEGPRFTDAAGGFQLARHGRANRSGCQFSLCVRDTKLMETNTTDRVLSMVSRELDVPLAEIKPETTLTSLVTDSLEMTDLILAVEAEFGSPIPYEKMSNIFTVGDLISSLEPR